MWRNFASNLLSVLVVALVVATVVIGWGQSQYTAKGPLAEPICLQVPPGGSMITVADDLDAKEAISNATIFRLGADYSGRAPDLKAGSYLIAPGASMHGIVAQITGTGVSSCGTEVVYVVSSNAQTARVRELNPSTQKFEVIAEYDPKAEEEPPAEYLAALEDVATGYRVVVAEGVTSWQVVEALKASDLFEGEVAEVPEEGSLAPDGYEIRPGADRAAFLAEMAEAQAEILATAWAARAADLPVETPLEALVLASIIEKETGVAEERPLVASVFVNRLKQGIKLQTDPTVIYGITEGKGALGRGLRQSELRKETPWNTYVIDGLPPTPIANPGKESIEAALNPAQSEYIFFVADGSGGHAFAEELDEHNRNVARWREIEAERADQ